MQQRRKNLESKADPASLPPAKDSVKKCKVMPPAKALALREEAYRILGVDLTTIPGISVLQVQTILAELGSGVSKFRSAGAFSSWMGLCPDNDISGGKVLWSGTRKVKNRVALTLRMAAQSLQHSQSALGEFYRRMRAKLGAPKAIAAAAHKLARVVYHLLTTREPYDDSVFAKTEERYRKRTENRLKAQAHALGFTLVPANARSRGRFLRSSAHLRFTGICELTMIAPRTKITYHRRVTNLLTGCLTNRDNFRVIRRCEAAPVNK
jgi:transposase